MGLLCYIEMKAREKIKPYIRVFLTIPLRGTSEGQIHLKYVFNITELAIYKSILKVNEHISAEKRPMSESWALANVGALTIIVFPVFPWVLCFLSTGR